MRASQPHLRTHNANPAKGLHCKISPQADIVGARSNANGREQLLCAVAVVIYLVIASR
jgi:hypothetical protein